MIKLGALGDFIQALGPMAAIRRAHANDRITLLTTKPYEEFARNCGYFDDIWLDNRPGALDAPGWLSLRKKLTEGGFKRVYDLQNNDRTSIYFKLFRKKNRPEWVGAVKGASHRNASPDRSKGHAFEGHVQTLALAGIKDIEIDDLNWIKADISEFNLPQPYILFVPGSSPQHPHKRWSPENYASIAALLSKKEIRCVLLGTSAESAVTRKIKTLCPGVIDLTGQTSLFQIAALARDALGAVGNDTGPMHLIAATGCPSLALFSGSSNKVKHAPRGQNVFILQEDGLENLEVKTVYMALRDLFSLPSLQLERKTG
ncbi:MAG: glycosyltransferase family 9 protein [Rhodospirillales bacterium]|nr:glycosyltransferase family 9 protein [Alphaproteobacteria bacterium]MCB1840665.1 glycosyltransferase family 9 protein [Alphaproteobacteria bacterium]MCB9977085.1 glycosyltransferase family 9 protein [Rhodospirillales bacterium]MCB9977845.1 glycosyltransferase family 9 protein [Rhodospirillales bacterium]